MSSSAFIPAALSCSFSPFSIVELCVSFFSIVDLVVDSSAMSIFCYSTVSGLLIIKYIIIIFYDLFT